MQSVSLAARSSPRPTPSRGRSDGRAPMNWDDGNKRRAAQRQGVGAALCLADPYGYEQGAGGSSSVPSADRAHRLVPRAPRRQRSGEGMHYGCRGRLWPKNTFSALPLLPLVLPTPRLLTTVPSSPFGHQHGSYPQPRESLLCLHLPRAASRGLDPAPVLMVPQSRCSGKGGEASLSKAPGACPALPTAGERWAPSFTLAGVRARRLPAACTASATASAACDIGQEDLAGIRSTRLGFSAAFTRDPSPFPSH